MHNANQKFFEDYAMSKDERIVSQGMMLMRSLA